jgi:preprotein translocase SecE subunit
MARNRQRGRRGAPSDGGIGPRPTEPHRENVPGELDHASGDAEEFEATIVSGANGSPDETAEDEELDRIAEESLGDLDDDGDVDEDDERLSRQRPTRKDERARGPRFWVFLQACWAELQRVQWPDRRQVGQATAVVIGFVIIAGAYLGFADWVAKQIVNFIL